MLSTVSDKWLMSLKKADENKNGIFREPPSYMVVHHTLQIHTPRTHKK